MALLKTKRMKTLKIISIAFVLLIFFYSCNVSKKWLIDGQGSEYDALINAVTIFSKSNKSSKGKTFYIFNDSYFNHNFYSFKIVNINYVDIKRDILVAKKAPYFPNSYIEINNNLFVWSEIDKNVNRKTIEILHEYKVLDSTIYKIEMGELSSTHFPKSKINDSKKGVYYFICKNDISNFKTLKTQWVLEFDEFPNIKCE